MILRRLWILAVLIAVIPACLPAASVVGDWNATLQAGPQRLRLALHVVEGSANGLSATLDSLDQGANGLKIDAITLDGSHLEFRMNRLMAGYDGVLSEDGKSIEGTWTQASNSIPLRFERVADGAPPAVPAGLFDDDSLERLAGAWTGRLAVEDVTLRVILHVGREEGQYRVELESPDQASPRLPVTAISVAGEAVRFSVAGNGGAYEGTLQGQGAKIKGTWTQAGRSFPLDLARPDAAP